MTGEVSRQDWLLGYADDGSEVRHSEPPPLGRSPTSVTGMTISTGPGQVHLAFPPTCPTHNGPMRLDLAADLWTCCGWDGEGCDYTCTAVWLRLGETGPAQFSLADSPGSCQSGPREEQP